MNKTRIAMCAIGAAGAVATLAAGVMAWLESDSRSEAAYTLEAQVSRRDRNAGASKEFEAAALANAAKLEKWTREAYAAMAADGRREPYAAQDPAAFKALMVEQARAFAARNGTSEGTGKIVKNEFGFGFDDLVWGRKIPAQQDLPLLQRRWFDIMGIAKIVADCGAGEILAISVAGPRTAPQPETGRASRSSRKKEKPDPFPVSEERYVFKFSARPAALVRILNALSSNGRFYDIETMSFEQDGDPLAHILGADKDKEAAGGRKGRRGRLRRRQLEDEEKQEAAANENGGAPAKKGLVTDPASCAPFTVAMTIATLEFTAKETGK